MHSETKNDIVTFFGCIICCVSLGSSFIIPIIMRKPLSFEEETGIQSNTYDVSPIGDAPIGEDPFNNTDNLGWELLDDGNIIHAWNNRDSYYFNNSNGLQFSNHWNEYWSTNVLMIGYYSGEDWNLIYRTDELSGFNKDFEGETDNFMNLTLWKDLSYGSYNFRLALRYHLKSNDSDLTVIPYIKNLGINIPFDIGFGWELKDIQVGNTVVNDNIRVNETSYRLNQSLDNKYTNLSYRYTHTIMEVDEDGNWTGNYTTKNQTIYNTRFTLFDDTKSIREILYMRWDRNLSYLLQVKSRSGQVNAPVTLFIRVGTLDVNQEKSTLLNWYDATGDYPTIRDDWEYAIGATATTVVVNKPSGTVENDLLVAFVATDGVETFIAPSGWTGIAEVESDACSLASFYKVATSSEPSDYTFTWFSSEDAVGSIVRITGADTSSPIHVNTTAFESATGQPVVAPDITTSVDNCVILRVHVLDDNDEGDDYDGYPPGHVGLFAKTDTTCSHSVAYENLSGQGSAGTATWSFANAEEWVTFSIAVAPATATLPSQSNEAPTNGSIDVAVSPSLFVVCNDINNDTMRAIWRSNSTDGVTWVTFASNTSISSGTNITQTNSNFSGGSEMYWWCVNLTDDYSDTSWTNATYHFSTSLSIPEIQVVSPVNGSTGVSTTPTVQIKPWDNGTYAEDMTVKWYDNITYSEFYYFLGDNTSDFINGLEDYGDAWDGTAGEGLFNDDVTPITDVERDSISNYDNNKWSYGDDVAGEHNYHRFNITIDGTKNDVSSFEISIIAAPMVENEVTNNELGGSLWVYNWTSGSYENKTSQSVWIQTSGAGTPILSDAKWFTNVENTFATHYVHDDGHILFGIQTLYPGDGGGSDQASYTFAVYLNVTYQSNMPFTLQETDNDVSSGNTASWTYTNASSDSTEYWWKVIVNNSQQTNGSTDWYSFTTSAGEEVEEWNINITGYLTGGNDTLLWAVSTPGYLTGGNDTLAWTIDTPGWLSGGNDTLDWSNSVTGYLLGGNTSSYATDIIGYLTGGNDTLSWTVDTPGWLTGGNDTLDWDIPITGYLIGGNDSSWSISIPGYLTAGNDTVSYSVGITGYLTGGNDTVFWSNSVTGYLTGGNETVTVVWNLSKTGYLLGGNDTLSWSNSVTGWLTGGNESVPDTTLPNIIINFAGNLTDSGGPYWNPTTGDGETVQLVGAWSDGYYTNDSRQSEGFIDGNLTITDIGGIEDTEVWFNLLNRTGEGDTWTNWTYLLINVTGGYYEFNTSDFFDSEAGYNYSFNIVVNDTTGNSNWTGWNKTATVGDYGANNIIRRFVQLNCTPESIEYQPLYFIERNESFTGGAAYDREKYDRLHHDQGLDGTADDTGYLRTYIPIDDVQEIFCVTFVGLWFDESIPVETFTLDTIYYHTWVGQRYNNMDNVGYETTRKEATVDAPSDYYVFDSSTDARSTINYAGSPFGQHTTYNLTTNLLDVSDKQYTDNNIYELMIKLKTADWPETISNRSFNSFVLLNVPSNASLLLLDSDSDGLNDYDELWTAYTNPFISDTDNDGVSDYTENNVTGSDPNNYTDSIYPSAIWNLSKTGYLIGGNDTLSWNVDIPGYLIAGNDTLAWTVDIPGWLSGGNDTLVWNIDIPGWLTGGNDTLEWSIPVTGYLTGGNETITTVWNLSKTGYLTGGNDTLGWALDIPGYLTGGNDTVSYSVDTTGYLLGGNESSTVVWNLSKTGWLSGGNDTLEWSIPVTGYLIGGSDNLAYNNVNTGYLTGGNDTLDWSNSVTGYLLGGNESTGAIMGTPNPANNSQTRNTAPTWSIPINNTYGIFDWTINCSNGQNSSADNEANGTKTLSLTGLQYTTYTVWVNTTDAGGTEYYWYKFTVTVDFDGNFTIDVQNQKATASPTISNAVDYYRFIIEGEDGFTGETDWIPAEDIGDQLYNLNWDQEYSITMWYKNETLMGWFSRQFSTPSEPIVEIDPEEPIDVEDDPPRKNIYDGIIPEGMSNWWNERNDIEKIVMVLPFLAIFLFFISRRKRDKKYYHVKKQGEEEKDDSK